VNILIVDDSRLFRISNERALVKAGHHVISAEDGEAGLRLALEHKPDMVVLDMMLPKLSGQDVLRALRNNPTTASIPVMVLSGLPQCNENKLLSEGATAYFQKSGLKVENGPNNFVDAVERLLVKVKLKAARAR
jgi:two-component system cell cycle response regulator DivK